MGSCTECCHLTDLILGRCAMSFIFDNIDYNGKKGTGYALKLGDYSYFFRLDSKFPQITFKTKYELENFHNRLFKHKSRKYTRVIDIDGNILLKTTEMKEDLKQLPYNKSEKPKFSKYDYVYSCPKRNNKKFYVVVKKDKYGVIDEDEKIIIDFDKYNHLFPYHAIDNTYFFAKDKGTNLEGIIDINRNIIIPFIYDKIYYWNYDIERNTLIVEKDGKCALIDLENNILIPFKYKYIFGFSDFDYSFAADENNKWGVINRNGKEIEFDLNNVKELKF